jgi:4-amino-4-deoxy-L-arabinose transferase-like glycosyltransferase
MTKSVLWLALLLGLISAFFRFYNLPTHVEFLGDQGRDVRIMRDLLHGNLVFIGPQTSVGNMYLGPWFYYFMAPSLFLANYSPVGPAAFTALMGVLTVILLFFVVLDLFKNQRVAIVSALLFALSPTVIRYSIFSWNPNIMPLFALLFFWTLYRALFRSQPKLLLLASLSFIMCFNSHYLALVLLPIALIMLIISFLSTPAYIKSRPFIIYIILSIFFFLVSLFPLVLFDIKHSGQNFGAILKFFSERETTVNLKFYKGLFKFPELISLVSTSLLGAGNILLTAVMSSILALFWFISFKSIKQLNSKALISIGIYTLVSLVFLGLYKQHVYDHYFGFLYPFIFILIGLPLGLLLSHKNRLFQSISVLTLTVILVNFILRTPLFQPAVNQVSRSQTVASFINLQSNNRPYNLALIAKQNYDSPYRYFLELSGSPVKSITELHTSQLFVICEPWGLDSCNPINHPFYDIAAFGWAQIDQTWEVSGVKVFRLIPNPSGKT